MKKMIEESVLALPAFAKNTHLNVSLEGWEAVSAVISICVTVIVVKVIGVKSDVVEADLISA